MNFVSVVLKEILFFFNEVSIYLLFGFIMAGVLHILFPESIIRRHLGRNSFYSVIKSTLFGIPIPLCSCGVVPVAASLKRSGASKGATISFLISTPQVGADSFMITFSLLGWVFGLFRIAASLITSMTAGIIVNIISGHSRSQPGESPSNGTSDENFGLRLRSMFDYIEYDLMGSIANALLVGIIAAGIIGVLIPDGFFEKHLGSDFMSMLLMLIVGIPMYVCASASTPIAASLVMKGISPGAALVFLLTGPATNAVTISTVIKILGKRSTAVYLATIAVVSLGLGYLLNILTARYGFHQIILLHQHEMLPGWLKVFGSIMLALMLGWYYLETKILNRTGREKDMGDNKICLDVQGMTCMHCAGNVKKAVESVAGISGVSVDLARKIVLFQTEEGGDIEKVKEAIVGAGYNV